MLRFAMTEAVEPELVAAVENVSAGPVTDALRTAAVWRFPHPDGQVTQAPLWVLRTPGQLWLGAVHGNDVFLEATGDAEGVEVVRGWTRDQLKIGVRLLGLARRTADQAEALLDAFRADAGGPVYPEARPPQTGPVADGAIGVPDWWADHVPGDSSDPWLHGYTLASEWTFNVVGASRKAPLVLGIRGRAMAIAAHWAGQTHADEIEGPVEATTAFGRTRLEIGAYRLDGGRLDSARAETAARIANADEPHRWAISAAVAMDDGRAHDAAALWTAALGRGFRSALTVDLAVVAVAVDRLERAVTLLRESGDRVDSNWMSRVSAWRRTAAKSPERLVELIEKAAPAAPSPGPGWPWPPASPAEVWAAAGGPATLPEPPSDPRRLQVQAAVAESREPAPVAAAAYRVAARAWATTGDFAAAYQTLRSALRLDPGSPDQFQAAAWAWATGRDRDAEDHIRAGLAISPGAEALLALDPPADVLQRSAEISEQAGHRQAAARIQLRLLDATQPPLSREARLDRARKVARELEAPAEAAAVIEAIAAAVDRDGEEDVGALWLEAAALYGEAGRSDEAMSALRRSVQSGFLRADSYRFAAEQARSLDPKTSQWWSHIAHVLSGSPPPGQPRAPVDTLSKTQLDALHPGGAGWLSDVRKYFDAPTPPPRDQLIRGLERLESNTFAHVFEAIGDVCNRLGMVPPATYVYRGDDAYGMSVWPVEPPVLLVGHQHLVEGPRHLAGDALKFGLAVELAHLACDHPLLDFDDSLVGTSKSAYQAFGRFAGTAETVVDLVTLVPGIDQLKKLETFIKLSRRVLTGWKTVDKASSVASPMLKWFGSSEDAAAPGGIGRGNLEGAALQFRLHADRAALLVSGNIRSAVECVLKTSSKGVQKIQAFERDGLASVLQTEAEALAPDEALRLSALVSWSAGLTGANDVDHRGPGV